MKADLLESAKRKAAETYNSAAEHFDDVPLGFWHATGQQTVSRLRLKPGARVLDIGCGTGASAIPAAEMVGPNGTVIGVDLAEKLLAKARARAEQHQLYNVEFRQADMSRLAYPAANFDAVVSVFSIFFVPDMVSLVQNLWRMLKPGGQLAITTWGPDFFEPMYTEWRAAIRAERPDLYSEYHPWDRISVCQQVRDLLQESGVPGAEVVPDTRVQPLRTPEDWWTVVLGSGLRGTVDAMDSTSAARIRERTINWAREHGVKAIQTNVIYAVAVKDSAAR